MDLGLVGRRAAVAAASRGLGRASAAALGGEGVRVAICGRDPAGGETTAAELGAVAIIADVSDPAEYARAFQLNALSTIAMCAEAVPGMQAQQWGRVVAITSISVRQPIPTLILSNTARAGVTGFLKTLAREVAADGVTVNSLQPGSHDTDRVRALGGGGALAAAIPAGRLGRPGDFGACCAFLCSESARFVTGAAIPVDGGAFAGLQ